MSRYDISGWREQHVDGGLVLWEALAFVGVFYGLMFLILVVLP